MGNHKCVHVTDLRGKNGSPPFISLKIAGGSSIVMLCRECHEKVSRREVVQICSRRGKPGVQVKRYIYDDDPIWFEVSVF